MEILRHLLLAALLAAQASATIVYCVSFYSNPQNAFVARSISLPSGRTQALIDGMSTMSNGRFVAYWIPRTGRIVVRNTHPAAPDLDTARRTLGEMLGLVLRFADEG